MKKIFALLVLSLLTFSVCTNAKEEKKVKEPKQPKQAKVKVAKTKVKKDVLKDDEYKELKIKYYNAEGYGDTYNCKVEKQRFCQVKDLSTGIYVLCDRDVSRTQWESAEKFFKYGRCVKMN